MVLQFSRPTQTNDSGEPIEWDSENMIQVKVPKDQVPDAFKREQVSASKQLQEQRVNKRADEKIQNANIKTENNTTPISIMDGGFSLKTQNETIPVQQFEANLGKYPAVEEQSGTGMSKAIDINVNQSLSRDDIITKLVNQVGVEKFKQEGVPIKEVTNEDGTTSYTIENIGGTIGASKDFNRLDRNFRYILDKYYQLLQQGVDGIEGYEDIIPTRNFSQDYYHITGGND